MGIKEVIELMFRFIALMKIPGQWMVKFPMAYLEFLDGVLIYFSTVFLLDLFYFMFYIQKI